MMSNADIAEFVGGILFDSPDPFAAGERLAEILYSRKIERQTCRSAGLDYGLVDAAASTLHLLDEAALKNACVLGAGWVYGYRSVPKEEPWRLVASFPNSVSFLGKAQKTIASTIIELTISAQKTLCYAFPYLDLHGIEYIIHEIVGATARGVNVQFYHEIREHDPQAIRILEQAVAASGKPEFFHFLHIKPNAPWAHLKVVVSDGQSAYIGSANMTGAGLGGKNVELGVLVHGPNVALIDRILNVFVDR